MIAPITLLILLGAVLAPQEPVSLNPEEGVGSVVPHLQWIEEAEGILTLDDALGNEGRFEPMDRVHLGGGDGQRYWARIAFRSAASETTSWVLPLGFDRVRATLIREDGTRETSEMGWDMPLHAWTHVASGIPSMRFDLGPRETVQVYIHVENGNGYAFSAEMTPAEVQSYEESRRQKGAFTLLFLGVFLALAIYKLFLFVSFRDASYLFYVLFLLNVSVFWATGRRVHASVCVWARPLGTACNEFLCVDGSGAVLRHVRQEVPPGLAPCSTPGCRALGRDRCLDRERRAGDSWPLVDRDDRRGVLRSRVAPCHDGVGYRLSPRWVQTCACLPACRQRVHVGGDGLHRDLPSSS